MPIVAVSETDSDDSALVVGEIEELVDAKLAPAIGTESGATILGATGEPRLGNVATSRAANSEGPCELQISQSLPVPVDQGSPNDQMMA